MPLHLALIAGCRVALLLMHPPRAPKNSKLTVAEPRGSFLGCNLFRFPSFCRDILGPPTEALVKTRKKLEKKN